MAEERWHGGLSPLSHAEATGMGQAMFDRWATHVQPPLECSDAAWADLARCAFERLRDLRGEPPIFHHPV